MKYKPYADAVLKPYDKTCLEHADSSEKSSCESPMKWGKNRSIERKGNKMNEQKINQLIEKYLNGDTSCREEDELRTYFATVKGDIPEAWQPLRQLFVWELHQRQQHKVSYPNRRRLHWSWLATAVSVAAVFIFLFMLTLQFQSSSANYVIINGEKTTNQETVIREAENALGNVSSTQQEDFNALFQIGETNHEN